MENAELIISELRNRIMLLEATQQVGQPFPVFGDQLVSSFIPETPQSGDVFVKVSATDATTDYLGAKLVEGYGIAITQIGGSGETQTLEISTKPGDGKPVVPEGSGGYEKVYSFESWRDEATTGIVMEQGDIYLGPLTFILWASIADATTTPSVSATDTHVWLEVRQDTGESTGSIGAGFAWMKYGSKADMLAALDATEQLTKCVVPLVETVWADGVITKVKNLQCGDAKISRAAG